MTIPRADVDRLMADIHALSEYRLEDHSGWTRPVFSAPYVKARDWVAARMTDAGLTVERDAVGNLIGTLPGTDPDLPPVVTGPHTDTVLSGGRLDGIYGVLGAIEAVRLLRANGPLARTVKVIDFVGEEASVFGISCMGSRAICNRLDDSHLALTDADGNTMAEGFRKVGGTPEQLETARWAPGDLHCFLELHIEQGTELERRSTEIGVVDAITGIKRFRGTFTGQADHAGGTPMDRRHDALTAAAECVLALEEYAAPGGGVATAGRLEIEPGQPNVVPGKVEMWAELRSPDTAWLENGIAHFNATADRACAQRGVSLESQWLQAVEPVDSDPALVDTIDAAAQDLGYSTHRMISAAGHDAMHMATLAPMAMIFVPSIDGRSHCPEEWTEPAQLANGVHVLAETIHRTIQAEGR